jgi:hypothetical protein
MSEPQMFGPAQRKVCDIFLGLGAAMLVFGVTMGAWKDVETVYVFAVLGGSVVLFGVALALLVKLQAYRNPDAAAAEPAPDAQAGPASAPALKAELGRALKAEPGPSSAPAPSPARQSEPAPGAAPGLPPPPTVGSTTAAKALPVPDAKSEASADAGADVAMLMNTTLGELLLSTIRKDPQGAAQLFAQAISRAQAPLAETPARAAQVEPLPGAKAGLSA